MRLYKYLLILISLTVLLPFLSGQQPNFRFKHLTVDDGLSQNWVRCVIQDNYGFMWFGTGGNGINRYDGYTFKVYKNNPNDNNSLTNNWINTIYVDKKHRIWAGTLHGLNVYDIENDRFVRFPAIQSEFINGLFESDEDKLYVITSGRIFEINYEKKTLIPYNESINTNFPDGFRVCEKDIEGNLLIGSRDGLFKIDIKNKTHTIFRHDENNPESLSDNFIQSLCRDSVGRIWIGTLNKGLSLMINENGESDNPYFINFTHDPDNINSISEGTVWAILDNGNGQLLIGIENEGLDILNLSDLDLEKENYKFKHIKYNIFDETSLSNNSINSIFKDNQGTIWIGTYSGGINYYNELFYKFEHCKYIPNDKSSLNNKTVNVFFEDRDNLWIGTEGGINILNRGTGLFKIYSYDPNNPKTIGSNSVWSIFEDSRNNIWIGTWAGGLNLYNKEFETFTRYLQDNRKSKGLTNNNIFEIAEDEMGYIWLATMGGGLNRYDYRTNEFKAYRPDYTGKNSISGDWVQTLRISSNNELWISTTDGVDIFDLKTEKFTNFKHDTADTRSISYNGANAIVEDSKKNIWLGTDAGLNLFVRKDSSFICYREGDGLPDNAIKGICEDDDCNLWLSTNNGISKFVNGINHPDKPVFKNYNKSDGLQANEFNRHAFYKGKDGTIYFGGINGFNYFRTDRLIENSSIPNVILTNLLIFNKPVEIGSVGSPLVKQLSECDAIILSYKHYVFTIEFTALNYISPEKNQFAYILEGFEKNWNYVGNKREATYTSIAPGTYTFRVKASNNDKVWNEEGTSIKIRILPPWWGTWWFRVFLSLTIAGLLIGFYFYRLGSLRRQREQLKQKVIERTKEIEEKNQILQEQSNEISEVNITLEERQEHIEEQAEELKAQAEDLQEVNKSLTSANATKDKFFSIIAHDLKNPFTTILGFCEVLFLRYDKYDDSKRKHLIEIISKSANNIYRLLENLLQWSRSQTGTIKFNPENFELEELVSGNFILMENQMKEKGLTSRINIPSGLKVFADKNMINTVIRNLINNAIKFSESGEIVVQTKEHGKLVTVMVKDCGVGMPEETAKSLFIIGGTKSSEGTRGELGTGLGLILCKDFVEKNGGTIGVESEINNGSTFYFTIPKERI